MISSQLSDLQNVIYNKGQFEGSYLYYPSDSWWMFQHLKYVMKYCIMLYALYKEIATNIRLHGDNKQKKGEIKIVNNDG